MHSTQPLHGRPPHDRQPRGRPDLANSALLWVLAATAACIAILAVLRPHLPADFDRPGSTVLHLTGVAGALLLLVPAAFAAVKRSGGSEAPNAWLVAHVLASCAGLVLVMAHTAGRLDGTPALLVLAVLGLIASGAVARLHVSDTMAATFATRRAPFREPDMARRRRLGALVARKQAVLARLDGQADEATFSVTPSHLLSSPRLALAYLRLARQESALIGARGSVPRLQAGWRPFHLALAWMFVAGLLVHVVTVTFFAGYVADGREIDWWHLAR